MSDISRSRFPIEAGKGIFQTQDADLERDVPNLPAWSAHEYYLQVLLHTAVYLYNIYGSIYICNMYHIFVFHFDWIPRSRIL